MDYHRGIERIQTRTLIELETNARSPQGKRSEERVRILTRSGTVWIVS